MTSAVDWLAPRQAQLDAQRAKLDEAWGEVTHGPNVTIRPIGHGVKLAVRVGLRTFTRERGRRGRQLVTQLYPGVTPVIYDPTDRGMNVILDGERIPLKSLGLTRTSTLQQIVDAMVLEIGVQCPHCGAPADCTPGVVVDPVCPDCCPDCGSES